MQRYQSRAARSASKVEWVAPKEFDVKRAATFLIPAFLLLAFAAFLGFTNGFVLERGSPTGLLKNYAEAGSEGDLVALGELGDPRKIERESAILGQAYSDQVEHALFRGMVAGGHLAYAATKRLQEETLPQAVNAYWVEQPEGVEDRQLWASSV